MVLVSLLLNREVSLKSEHLNLYMLTSWQLHSDQPLGSLTIVKQRLALIIQAICFRTEASITNFQGCFTDLALPNFDTLH